MTIIYHDMAYVMINMTIGLVIMIAICGQCFHRRNNITLIVILFMTIGIHSVITNNFLNRCDCRVINANRVCDSILTAE